jgi:hypothetical protein
LPAWTDLCLWNTIDLSKMEDLACSNQRAEHMPNEHLWNSSWMFIRMWIFFEMRAYSVEKITPIIVIKVYPVSSKHHHQSIAKVFDKIIVAESTNIRSVLINLLVDAGLSWDPVAP